MRKDDSKTSKGMFDILDFIEFEGDENKKVKKENEIILEKMIAKKFKERGWERV